LQDQTRTFGNNFSRFQFKKRGVEDKNCGPFIKTIMTRCIHCTRCVRFCNEIAAVPFFTTFNRGVNTEIGNYNSKFFFSEISGNVIDLCPVGALTARSYSFVDRSWKEEKLIETIDLTDSLGSNMYLKYQKNDIIKIVPKFNSDINNSLLSDKARFSFDSLNKSAKRKHCFETNLMFPDFPTTSYFKRIKLRLLILINGEISLLDLQNLKSLENENLGFVRLRTIENIRQKNIYLSEIKDLISKLDETLGACFIFSSCLKAESTLLNARLRFQYINKEKNFDIYSFNRVIDNNIPTNFANLNIKYLIYLMEGKMILSSILFNSKQPSIIFGNSLKKSISDLNNLIVKIKSMFPKINILKINLHSNSESLELLNIKTFCSKDRFFIKKMFDPKLNSIVKFINPENYKIISFNLSKYQTKITHHFSAVKSYFENFQEWLTWFKEKTSNSNISLHKNSEIHLNLEGRPQKFNFPSEERNHLRLKLDDPSLNYINELLESPELFNTFSSQIIIKDDLNSLFFKESMCINLFPIKSDLERYYCSNELSKNSKDLQFMQKRKIKNSTNFLKID
jgi:hypothetical protein